MASGEGFAWSDHEWLGRQRQFFDEAGADSTLPPRPCSLPLVAGLLGARRIVDYGGGSGWAFELLRKSCPTLELTAYTVLELASVIDSLWRLSNVDSRLVYMPFDDMEHLPGADLLYANASLHYGESERPFHDAAISLGPVPQLLWDGYLAHPDQDLFLVQRVYGRDVPVRIPHLDRSLQNLRDLGYSVTSCTPMLGPVSGEYRYDLPLEDLGAAYSDVRRYCVTAAWNGCQ